MAIIFCSPFNADRDRPTRILLELNLKLAATHLPEERRRLFYFLQFFTQLLRGRVCEEAILKDVLHTLLRTMRDPQLTASSAVLLHSICQQALAVPAATQEIGKNLPAVRICAFAVSE